LNRRLCSIVLVSLLVFAGCGGAGGAENNEKSMTALVAANMTDAMNALMAEYEKQNEGTDLEASYDGTQILFTQIQQGVDADLFLSADLDFAKQAREEGFTGSFEPVSQTREVIIVPKGNPAGIESLEDLGTKEVELVVGVDNVPIGKYTRQVFANAEKDYGSDFTQRVMDNVVSTETNTKEVTQKAATGEAGASIVYVTDFTPGVAEKVERVEIPDEYNVPARNYAAVLKKSKSPELTRDFLDFILSPEGQKIIQKFKYEPVDG
jgi:molybdate transport system substrate-binding protein